MEDGAHTAQDRSMRIGATLILLMILYVSAYGLLRATHVLIRIGPGYRLVSAPMDASSSTTTFFFTDCRNLCNIFTSPGPPNTPTARIAASAISASSSRTNGMMSEAAGS